MNPLPKENRKHKRHNFAYSVQQKINIVHESRTQGLSIRKPAKLWGCCASSVVYHRQQLANYMEKVLVNPNAKTANKGWTPFDIELENNVNQWYKELEMEDIPDKTSNIIAYALSLQLDFKNGLWSLLQHWVYRFMRRYDLTLRRVTHKGQTF
jgi:Tc5 transposase DNA-binding domain